MTKSLTYNEIIDHLKNGGEVWVINSHRSKMKMIDGKVFQAHRAGWNEINFSIKNFNNWNHHFEDYELIEKTTKP